MAAWTRIFYVPLFFAAAVTRGTAADLPYPVVDTGQQQHYSESAPLRAPPAKGDRLDGQDAAFERNAPAYRDNRDGTVTDMNTRLMWVQSRGDMKTFPEAQAGASACRVGGHTDWRMPTIKELYSLIDFSGQFQMTAAASKPFINTRYFGFRYGDESQGARAIDCQDWSATQYIATTMNGQASVFGVNFADGRIKAYPRERGPRGVNRLYVRYVRGNPDYGRNDFHDNADGTITDRATGLMWSKSDSRAGMNWPAALEWTGICNTQRWLGHDDWRLPNAKELQSIVDYSRSPAIDPVFQVSRLAEGEYPFYWTSTTHLDGPPGRDCAAAVYIAFGRALGYMQFPPGHGEYQLLDMHGAGAQRSDPKTGDAIAYPHGRGPQGDVIRINNYVRLVRDADPSGVRAGR